MRRVSRAAHGYRGVHDPLARLGHRFVAAAAIVGAGGHGGSPGPVASHDFDGGAVSALRAGVIHGAFCLGCCWAITAVLLVVGLMNLLWMAGIFALFFIEKSWKHGLIVARLAGVALMVLGAAVIAWPELLAAIS
jgi:hypothetical protein